VDTADRLAADYEEDVALADASNAAVDLVHAGKLDEAEQGARDLLVRFPDVHDGYDRLGMVYEARGDNKQAAQYYRQALEFIRQRPEQYDDSRLEAVFLRLIAKLDPLVP
jgi:Tfp pilus assembly protein PilF